MELRMKNLVAILLVIVPMLSAQSCPKPSGETSSCVCETKDGIIDLRPASSDDGVASVGAILKASNPVGGASKKLSYEHTVSFTDNDWRYRGMEDPNNFVYEYNPCTTFTTVGDCANVYLCQESKDIPPQTFKIADAGTERMLLDTSGTTDQVTVFYSSTDPQFGTYREVYVHLECDKDVKEPIVTTTGDSIMIFTYDVSFKSCHACPGGCGGAGGGGGAAAGVVGIILMVLLIAGFAAYFIVGAVVMKVHYHKDGAEVIPQKIFWFALPGLIKAGFIFTFKPIYDLIKNRGSGGGGYKQEL